MVLFAYVIGFSFPCVASCATVPGCAMSAMSGGCPPATAVASTVGGARAHAGAAAEAADGRRRRRLLFSQLPHRPFVADVLGELAHVLGHRLPRLDREVHHDLRAERFRQLDAPGDAALLRRVRREG